MERYMKYIYNVYANRNYYLFINQPLANSPSTNIYIFIYLVVKYSAILQFMKATNAI